MRKTIYKNRLIIIEKFIHIDVEVTIKLILSLQIYIYEENNLQRKD